MILLPAIDLIAGRCVRLAQGDFALETEYSADPRSALGQFVDAGAEEIHLVDLDGARAREPRQHRLLTELARSTGAKLQIAGGFRTAEEVARMLDSGAARVVIGSLALDSPDAFAGLLERFGPDRLTLALDVRLASSVPMVASHGWLEDSGRTLNDVLRQFPSVQHLLVTDIARDGMLSGPNIALMQSIVAAYPQIALQASGGVAELGDLDLLRDLGAARAIVGKAIWEGRFSVQEGIARARG